MNKVELSVIIPAYNEGDKIFNTIKTILDFFPSKNIEVIVVDDGSVDNTFEQVCKIKDQNIKIIRNYRNYGKGYSVKRGVLHSCGDLVLVTDADLSTPIEEFVKLQENINNGYDIAIGSRKPGYSTIEKRQGFARELMGKFFGLFARRLLSHEIYDSQCGFKLFKGDCARQVFSELKINGYTFDIEALLLAKKFGFKIVEVGVRWRNNPDSKIKLISFLYFKVFFELLKIFVNRLKGHY